MLRRGRAFHGRLDPAHDVAVAIGLEGLELELARLGGSGPADTVKRSNWPGTRPPAVAVHVTVETASVTVPLSVVIGLASFVVWVVIVHPVMGFTSTDAIGNLVGNVTSSATVFAVSFSFGTEAEDPSPPFGNDDGVTSTCAEATPAVISMVTAVTAANTNIRIRCMGC